MDLGNEVDFTNNNITPLWKRRSDNDKKPKPRPLSYQIDGVHMTDFPVDDRCAFTLTQPAEKISTAPSNPAVLKHTLNKPAKKNRVVRSISIGYSNGRFSLSKFTKSEDDKNQNPTSPPKTPTLATKNGNGLSVWHDKNIRGPLKRLSNQFTLTSQKDQIIFGDTSSPTDMVSPQNSLSPQSQDVRGSPISPSGSPSCSSTSSIPSLSSSLSLPSDPPTPRSPSPSERSGGVLLHRQSSGSSQSSEGKPPPSPVILSTNSPAAQKMGTQQIIPKCLATDTRFSKPFQNRQERTGLGGVLDTGKSTFRPRSMFETGSFSVSKDDELEGEENTGLLTRGLRSKSYRRAVVSGVDMDVPSSDPKANRLSQPALKGVAEERPASPSPTKSKVN